MEWHIPRSAYRDSIFEVKCRNYVVNTITRSRFTSKAIHKPNERAHFQMPTDQSYTQRTNSCESSTFFCPQRPYASHPFSLSRIHRTARSHTDSNIKHTVQIVHARHQLLHTYTTTRNVKEEEFYRKRREEKWRRRKKKKNECSVWIVKKYGRLVYYIIIVRKFIIFQFQFVQSRKRIKSWKKICNNFVSVRLMCEINQLVMVHKSQTFHENTIFI